MVLYLVCTRGNLRLSWACVNIKESSVLQVHVSLKKKEKEKRKECFIRAEKFTLPITKLLYVFLSGFIQAEPMCQ